MFEKLSLEKYFEKIFQIHIQRKRRKSSNIKKMDYFMLKENPSNQSIVTKSLNGYVLTVHKMIITYFNFKKDKKQKVFKDILPTQNTLKHSSEVVFIQKRKRIEKDVLID